MGFGYSRAYIWEPVSCVRCRNYQLIWYKNQSTPIAKPIRSSPLGPYRSWSPSFAKKALPSGPLIFFVTFPSNMSFLRPGMRGIVLQESSVSSRPGMLRIARSWSEMGRYGYFNAGLRSLRLLPRLVSSLIKRSVSQWIHVSGVFRLLG